MKSERARLSGIHIKILQFFVQNPNCIDTARGISLWINEDTLKVRKALTDLVKHNILIAHDVTSTTGYSYTQDMKILRLVKKMTAPLKDNKGRTRG